MSINTKNIKKEDLSSNLTSPSYYPFNLSSFRNTKRNKTLPDWIPNSIPFNIVSRKIPNKIIPIKSSDIDPKSESYGPVFLVIINGILYIILVMLKSKNVIIYSHFRLSSL